MSNATTADTIRSFQNYLGASFTDATKPWDFTQAMFRYFMAGDSETWTPLASVTNTAQAVKASAGALQILHVVSPSAASNGVYVMVYNTAAAGVNVGTTAPRHCVFVPAGEAHTFMIHQGNGNTNSFGTAISVAAASSFNGAGAPAAADLPTVYVLNA